MVRPGSGSPGQNGEFGQAGCAIELQNIREAVSKRSQNSPRVLCQRVCSWLETQKSPSDCGREKHDQALGPSVALFSYFDLCLVCGLWEIGGVVFADWHHDPGYQWICCD